jgi:hypothetical protein
MAARRGVRAVVSERLLIGQGDATMSAVTPAPPRGRAFALRLRHPGERRSRSGSATRALDVLELFGTARRPLKAVEVARALGLHPSTANQLLKTMVDSAHLVFDARDKSYLPSPRLAAFAGWIVETYVDARLSELVAELHAATGMIVTVTTQNDLFMQVIEIMPRAGGGGERGFQVALLCYVM